MASNVDTLLLYVAPDGSDSWSGRMSAPNQFKTDGPFATLHRAIESIRELKHQQGGTLRQPVKILIRSGARSSRAGIQ